MTDSIEEIGEGIGVIRDLLSWHEGDRLSQFLSLPAYMSEVERDYASKHLGWDIPGIPAVRHEKMRLARSLKNLREREGWERRHLETSPVDLLLTLGCDLIEEAMRRWKDANGHVPEGAEAGMLRLSQFLQGGCSQEGAMDTFLRVGTGVPTGCGFGFATWVLMGGVNPQGGLPINNPTPIQRLELLESCLRDMERNRPAGVPFFRKRESDAFLHTRAIALLEMWLWEGSPYPTDTETRIWEFYANVRQVQDGQAAQREAEWAPYSEVIRSAPQIIRQHDTTTNQTHYKAMDGTSQSPWFTAAEEARAWLGRLPGSTTPGLC